MLRQPYLRRQPLDQAKLWLCCASHYCLHFDRRDRLKLSPFKKSDRLKVSGNPLDLSESPADFSLFYRWINPIFGYVVRLYIAYILTRGIVHIWVRLRNLSIWRFLEKSLFKQSEPPAYCSFLYRWIRLICGYMMHLVVIHILGFRVQGSRFGVSGLGFRVWGLGFGVWGLGFGVWV